MKTIIEFIQSLGTAEYLIGIALVIICVIAWFDARSIDRKYDADNERFEKHRK